jgi:integrase/recombinase XerD
MNCKTINNLRISFWLRRQRENSNGKAPLICRIVHRLQTCEFSTGLFVTPSQWNAEEKMLFSNTPEAKIINQRINLIKEKFDSIAFDLDNRDIQYTANYILDVFRKQNEDKPKGLIEILEKYILSKQKKGLSNSTIEGSQYKIKMLKSFLEWYAGLKKKDFFALNFDTKTIDEYVFFCQKVKKYANIYTHQSLMFFKAGLQFAVNNKWIHENPMSLYNFNFKKTSKELLFMTTQELETLENYVFENQALQTTADCFIFQCYTGLAYIDLKNITKDNVSQGIDGNLWLFMARQKTGIKAMLPIHQKALAIIEKYGNVEKLPVKSNQKYNTDLKKIGQILGFDKVLTTHMGRKTFAMLALNDWHIPIETVSKMLGHSEISITQTTYAQIQERKIANDMKHIINKTKPNTL